MMSSYEGLAASYDALTTDVGYEKRADFLEKLFRRSRIPVHTVLDLACGTGTMTWLLTDRGYELIGVDGSEEMLAAASETSYFGGSMTMEATGIVDELRRKGRYRLFDGVDYTLPPEERIEIRRQGLLADLYISGINAITEEGALYWLDGIGNRVAAIAFGPRKVLLVAGRNKIVATRAAAEARIRDIAAPRNVARLGQKTPCAVTGVCADCDSEGRICNTHLRMERCFPRKRITVILIDEEMGL